jgi:serine/threonine-protein kinase RsbW
MSSEPSSFHLAIESRYENIELAQVVLEETLEALGAKEDYRHRVDLAVREAVANAIKHGNRLDPRKRAFIDFALDGEDVVIRVRDEGDGFDAQGVADPTVEENLLKPGGRGLLYMRSYMDGVEVHRHPEGGTEVVLRKRRPSAVEGPSVFNEEKNS